MIDLIIRIISSIFIGIVGIIGFIFSHILKGFGTLIQQLTVKAGMLIFGFALIGYIASHLQK